MNKNSVIFVEHILENIEDIETFSKDYSKKEIAENKEKLNAIVRSLEIIGEAIKNLPDSLKKEYSEVPWKEIVGTRDLLIHHYFGIDTEILWNIISKELKPLKLQIIKIKQDLISKNIKDDT